MTSITMDTTTATLKQKAAVISNWIQRCDADHAGSSCKSVAAGITPKRLVHLDPTTDTARLITTPTPVPPYVALSYVWGPAELSLTTTTANLAQMQSAIPISTLPATLSQVFTLCRHLSIPHLWIDALCIVQDDPHDKTTEIDNMGYIYWNARLQIAAMASRGASHGLLPQQSRDQHPPRPAERDYHHLIMRACRSLRQNVWDDALREFYPLLTRGWTFQERILARRCVHFTVSELVWECKRTRWCECEGIESSNTNTHTNTNTAGNLINNMSAAFEACIMLRDAAASQKVIPMWRECVMGYSKRRLTDPEDRLVAISGIARILRGTVGREKYLAGLWADAMPFELLWRCDQSRVAGLGASKTRRPSWSWCSVDCGVDWPAVEAGGGREENNAERCGGEFEQSLEYLTSGTYFEGGLTGVRVMETRIEPEDVGFGPVELGMLILWTRAVPVEVKRHAVAAGWMEAHQTEWIIEGQMGRVLPFYPDIQLPELAVGGVEQGEEGSVGHDQLGKYVFVEIASKSTEAGRWEAGLVVRKGVGDDAYERVGMAGWIVCQARQEGCGFFDFAQYSRVALV
ncbi:heterokaryon incompatibility protein-domain-containing protein [Podospora appendiculata]|uniref:Heterokaryon incompatibility protein-domain-containing protein n=1 Tax=Podospora appendiculata TaxID=314037 RepID=A0AAE0X9R0_9PEZI|nr:heterokaryon incompatibility protein-domain-containing protein [Podospora appendiculata]